MGKVIFVIGATAAGKTWFINKEFQNKGFEILNVYDYQQRVYEEAGYKDAIPFGENFRCLYKANKDLLEDIVKKMKLGKDVVVEHTLYKMRRRLSYLDEIRNRVHSARIIFYVMHPGDEQWKRNIESRKLEESFGSIKSMADEIEIPNPAEGIDEIYEVVNGEIIERMDPSISASEIENARKELKQEASRIREEDEQREKHEELLESMNTRPFWHYCEICQKKEYVTADEAYEKGWHYPPKDSDFGLLLGPRICGDCNINDSLFAIVHRQSLPIVVESTLTPEQLKTWRRIKAEPESLLIEEEG